MSDQRPVVWYEVYLVYVQRKNGDWSAFPQYHTSREKAEFKANSVRLQRQRETKVIMYMKAA